MISSAAAWFSLSAAVFKECASVILVTDGIGKIQIGAFCC